VRVMLWTLVVRPIKDCKFRRLEPLHDVARSPLLRKVSKCILDEPRTFRFRGNVRNTVDTCTISINTNFKFRIVT
jgi:hypothetical protein